ncbi:MAG: T9SS type A sorting domain-containing protein [Bacteroidota bacterium]
MKIKLLSLALFFTLFAFSQTNGWYQYHKTGESFAIDVDSNGNLHMGSDTSYIAYNPVMEMVFSYANITSQDLPVSKVRSIKANPVNNEIVMLTNGGNSITLYDGMTTYTNYNVDNSNYEPFDFGTAEFSYGDQGTLYIYNSENTRYQTFENGTFNASQSLSFNPMDIVESNDGSKVYFASETTGLWELDKATDSFTNFNTSNSDIHTNFLTSLYKDASGLIYAGGIDGISTYNLITGMFDLVYQETWSVNPAVIYDVESMEVFSDGRFLAKTQPLGWAILDLTNDVYTHYDNNDFCNPRNVVIANDEIYVQPAFGELTVFDPNTITCTEKDTNHLNVGDIGLFGALGIAIRPTPNNTNSIDVLWTNNAICGPTQTCSMYSLTLPLDFSGGPFADANANISVSDAGLNQIAVFDINNQPAVVVGETNGYRILEEDGTEHTIAHGIDGYRPFQNKFVVEGQGSGNPPATPKIAVLSGGFDSNNEYANYIGNIRTSNNTLGISELSFTNANTSNTGFVGTWIDAIQAKFLLTSLGIDSNRYSSVIDWYFDSETHDVQAEDNVSALSQFRPEAILLGAENVDLRIQSSPDRRICTRNDTTDEYECGDFDFNGDGENDQLLNPFGYSDNSIPEPIDVDRLYPGLSGADGTASKTREFAMLLADLGVGNDRNSQRTVSTQQIPDVNLDGLPDDFFILNSFVYVYSDTHLAAALSTTYGLLVNSAIDYSSLMLSTDDVALNEKNILIYPNPTSDQVSFSDKTITKADLFDINGRKILEVTDNSFSIKNLAKGVYIIKAINTDGATLSGKLIKN